MSTQPSPVQSQTLAQMIRSKYPGSYDDLSDTQLEQKILAKYPQYSDLPRSQAQPQGTPIPSTSSIGPQKTGILPWLGSVESDLRYGGTQTLPGRVLHALGAQGLNVGSQAQAGNFVGSPATGTLQAAQGIARLPWQPWEGAKQIASGALDASQLPVMAMMSIPEAGLADSASKALETAGQDTGLIGTAKGAIGDALRNPTTGRLRPVTKAAARAVGAGTGYEAGKSVGHPMEGLLIGGALGPEAADAMVPDSASAMYEQRAQMLMRRGREQAALDRQAARESAAQTNQVVTPGSSEPLFSGSEGRAATWTNQDVMRLAAQGNRDAIAQAVRRGLQLPENARYVMGSPDYPRAVYNPREVTRFEPEGTPIRNKANPKSLQPPSGKKLLLPWMPE